LKVLLDTHFLIWILVGARRLDRFPWLERYRPWGVSPFSLLEIRFLAEVGRLEIETPAFYEALESDPRFVIDEPQLLVVIRHALTLEWTRDPFDRLLAAHSNARRSPLCTVDETLLEHHPLVPRELME
jgi:PIN domain nuclease of toxin-antitoxin system